MGTVTDAVKAVNDALARHKSKTEEASAEHKAWVIASFLAIRKEFFPCVTGVHPGGRVLRACGRVLLVTIVSAPLTHPQGIHPA